MQHRELPLTMRGKSKFHFVRNKYTSVTHPYRFWGGGIDGWRITFGTSGFWVASGAGGSTRVGMKMYRDLVDEYHQRKKHKNRRIEG